ncbi:MAG: methyltransferase [Lachnospiraceae bacterium]|nr:methyltransferase [Lachnospiraceae bacterium]
MGIELYQKLERGEEPRRTLAALKEALRGESGKKEREEILAHCCGDFSALAVCFSSEDAKARKNAALVAGELAVGELLPLLWEAYNAEETRFVKSAYLEAIKHYDYTGLLPGLKQALARVNAQEVTKESRKHLQEERMLLRELVAAKESVKWHRYKGEGIVSDLVLTTNRNHRHVLFGELGAVRKKEFGAGVIVQVKEPEKLLALRTFEEMFFVLPGAKVLPPKPEEAAEMLLQAGIVKYLQIRHEQNGTPLRFRIEMRGKLPLEKRGLFVRRMAAVLEEGSSGMLANVTEGYEFELRLIEAKEGGYRVLIKLFTLYDRRFSYRQKTISTGMRPANAALCMALADLFGGTDGTSFFNRNARVLDPFCGAGTMLIERAKRAPVKEMFGVDILSEAVDCARINTQLADVKANYIHRDFFTFTKEEPFTEIVTDMPFTVTGEEEKERGIEELYRRFFLCAPKFLCEDGRMLILTHDRALVRRYAPRNFTCIKEFELSMKEGSYLFLFRKGTGY